MSIKYIGFFLAANVISTGLAGCISAPPPSQQEKELLDLALDTDIIPADQISREAIATKPLIEQVLFWSEEFEKNPADFEAGYHYARVQRKIGNSRQAAEIAWQILPLYPTDEHLITLLGKSLIDIGQDEAAVDVLREGLLRAENNVELQIEINSALGVALDRTGRHRAAQQVYKDVLIQKKNHLPALANLGLSYALSGDSEQAEIILRQAVNHPYAGPKIRQNLALVLGLQGRFEEAAAISSGDLPDDQVEKNLAYLRSLLSPKRRWGQLSRNTQP